MKSTKNLMMKTGLSKLRGTLLKTLITFEQNPKISCMAQTANLRAQICRQNCLHHCLFAQIMLYPLPAPSSIILLCRLDFEMLEHKIKAMQSKLTLAEMFAYELRI